MSVDERDPETGHRTTGHEWNGIRELNARVPRAVWWAIGITHVWALAVWLLLPAWPLGETYTEGLLGIDQRELVAGEIEAGRFPAAHWDFLARPAPGPEAAIGKDPNRFFGELMAGWTRDGTLDAFDPSALEAYRQGANEPSRIHAMCEDYRAGASIDLDDDREDRDRRIACPLLVLWGARGLMHRHYDVLGTWRDKAADVRGHAIDCGHFLAEEQPVETLAALLPFLRGEPAG